MGWLNFGGKKRDRAQGFGDSSKTKSRKRPKSREISFSFFCFESGPEYALVLAREIHFSTEVNGGDFSAICLLLP